MPFFGAEPPQPSRAQTTVIRERTASRLGIMAGRSRASRRLRLAGPRGVREAAASIPRGLRARKAAVAKIDTMYGGMYVHFQPECRLKDRGISARGVTGHGSQEDL